MKHITVLKDESIQQLNLQAGSVVVDCTLGSGGHSEAMLRSITPGGTLIAFDADPAAIAANQKLQKMKGAMVHLMNANFRDIQKELASLALTSVDAILADLGWRMEQFASTEGEPRGFSFNADEPLLMTYGAPSQYSFTAADIINEWNEEDIANVIYGYGEDRAARRIARAIMVARAHAPITTSQQLAELIADTVKVFGHSKIHPATRTFQALRIAVNDEFVAIEDLLRDGFQALRPGGRMSIISFHSLEDRIVKHTFRQFVHDQLGVLVHKKPTIPSPEELLENPRARSAKLRTIEKLP